MYRVNMSEPEQEDTIYVARDGIEAAMLTLVAVSGEKRIGAAKGRFTVPDEFNSEEWNNEIEELFENGGL